MPERTDRDDRKCRKRSKEEDTSFYFAFMRNDYELGFAVLDYISGWTHVFIVTAVLAYYSVILRNGVLIYSLHEAGPRHLDHPIRKELCKSRPLLDLQMYVSARVSILQTCLCWCSAQNYPLFLSIAKAHVLCSLNMSGDSLLQCPLLLIMC